MDEITPEETKKITKEFFDSAIGTEIFEHIAGCDYCAELNAAVTKIVFRHIESLRHLK